MVTVRPETVLVEAGAEDEAAAPARFELGPPMPNPSRDRAALAVVLPEAGDLRVEAYDVLEAGALAAGPYVVRAVWQGEGRSAEMAVRRLTVVR